MELNEVIGTLVSDLSHARQLADYTSVMLSGDYNKDPLLKHLPVPHYSIEQVEVEFPLIVTGLRQGRNSVSKAAAQMSHVARSKLHPLVLDALTLRGIAAPDEALLHKLSSVEQKVLDWLESQLAELTAKARPLELSDRLERELYEHLLQALGQAPEAPLSAQDLSAVAAAVGRGLYSEFRSVMVSLSSLKVEPFTGKLNEYAGDGNLLKLKLRIREQDLDFVSEQKNDGELVKYLSLM